MHHPSVIEVAKLLRKLYGEKNRQGCLRLLETLDTETANLDPPSLHLCLKYTLAGKSLKRFKKNTTDTLVKKTCSSLITNWKERIRKWLSESAAGGVGERTVMAEINQPMSPRTAEAIRRAQRGVNGLRYSPTQNVVFTHHLPTWSSNAESVHQYIWEVPMSGT